MKKGIYFVSVIILGGIIGMVGISLALIPKVSTRDNQIKKVIEQSSQEKESDFTIDRVVDGDTIHVLFGTSTKYIIRILGINTPEVVDPRRPVECFGKEASAHLKELLPRGTYVHLIADKSQTNFDKYGRLLRYVELGTSTDVGLSMIQDGFAYQYLFKNPYARYQQYVAAEKVAQKNRRGLWGAGCR